MILAVGLGCHEVGGATGVIVAVHVRVHGSTHAYFAGIEVLDIIVGMIVVKLRVEQFGTLVGSLDHTHGIGDRLLGLGLGQRLVGVDNAQGQAQTQRVGKLHPLLHVAVIDIVIVLHERAVGLSKWGEHVDGVVQLLKKLFVHVFLLVVGGA